MDIWGFPENGVPQNFGWFAEDPLKTIHENGWFWDNLILGDHHMSDTQWMLNQWMNVHTPWHGDMVDTKECLAVAGSGRGGMFLRSRIKSWGCRVHRMRKFFSRCQWNDVQPMAWKKEHVWVNQRMNERMNKWLNEWMNEWMHELMSNQWGDARINEAMSFWTNEWANHWTSQPMIGWING